MDHELIMELSKKYILHWNCRGFTQLPEALRAQGGNVQEIYLKWNNLTFLPTWIGSLCSVTNLYLPYNLLTSLPDEIAHMVALSVLDVSHNLLRELPSSLGNLKGLVTLTANNNKLISLPQELCKLKSLETLEASSNKLRALPSRLDKCSSLREIIVDYNELNSLPNNIVLLPQLAVLCVGGNSLRYLPAVPFERLPWLRFTDNPYLNYIPYELGCQLTDQGDIKIGGALWNLKSVNCLSTDPTPKPQGYDLIPNQIITFDDHCVVLPLPLRIVISTTQVEIPPLKELALRAAYSLGNKYFGARREGQLNDVFQVLPSVLHQQLYQGPASLCQLQGCRRPVFEFAVVWVAPMCSISENRNNVTSVLAAMFFCSVDCSRAYAQRDPVLCAKQVAWSMLSQTSFGFS